MQGTHIVLCDSATSSLACSLLPSGEMSVPNQHGRHQWGPCDISAFGGAGKRPREAIPKGDTVKRVVTTPAHHCCLSKDFFGLPELLLCIPGGNGEKIACAIIDTSKIEKWLC